MTYRQSLLLFHLEYQKGGIGQTHIPRPYMPEPCTSCNFNEQVRSAAILTKAIGRRSQLDKSPSVMAINHVHKR